MSITKSIMLEDRRSIYEATMSQLSFNLNKITGMLSLQN